MQMRPILAALALSALLPLAACNTDPSERAGTWRATGANEANLRAMLAEPAHLSRGAQATDARSDVALPAIDHMLAGNRAELPSNSTASRAAIQGGSGGR